MNPAPTSPTAGTLLRRFAETIVEHDWPGLRGLLVDDARVRFAHTGETIDADTFVTLVRDYPGDWVFYGDEVVDAGDRAVLRSHTVIGDDVSHCATFATLDPVAGLLTDLLEVWTEPVAPHPHRTTQEEIR